MSARLIPGVSVMTIVIALQPIGTRQPADGHPLSTSHRTAVHESQDSVPADGFFTAEQAERGREAYIQSCSECHSRTEFRGSDFEYQWERRTAWSLYVDISWNMPEENPGGLLEQTYADIIAYILDINGYAAGDTELLPTQEAMATIPLGPGADKTNPTPKT